MTVHPFPEYKLFFADLRRAVDQVAREGTPEQKEWALARITKFEFVLGLVQQITAAGYEPREFFNPDIFSKDLPP